MGQLRAIVRLAAFVIVTLGIDFAWLAGVLFAPNRRRWRTKIFQTWARWVIRIVGLRVQVTGHAPRPPFLLVSNHLSYVDIVVLAARLDCVFVAKRDVRNWPVLGLMVRHMDTIFVDRENHRDLLRVNARMDQALKSGEGVVLFAEGTSTAGDSVRPLRPSLLEHAARRNFPVCHASINYRAPAGEVPAAQSICWWGDMKFAGHFFNLLKLPSFEARLVFGETSHHAADRKQLARSLHASIRESFAASSLSWEEKS